MPGPLGKIGPSSVLLVCLFTGLPSCGVQVNDWKEREGQHKKDHDKLETALRNLETRFDNDRRERSSEKWCKDTKVQEFVKDLTSGIPGTCTAAKLESSLLFMKTQAYAISNLRPGERIKDLHPARLGQLRELMEPQKLRPSTRLMVMLQPAADTDEAEKEALKLGQALLPVLYNEAHEPTLRILGPFLLPCRLKGVPKKLYSRLEDTPLPNEPVEGMPRIRVWVFRTDC